MVAAFKGCQHLRIGRLTALVAVFLLVLALITATTVDAESKVRRPLRRRDPLSAAASVGNSVVRNRLIRPTKKTVRIDDDGKRRKRRNWCDAADAVHQTAEQRLNPAVLHHGSAN